MMERAKKHLTLLSLYALKIEPPALQNMKFPSIIYFCGSILPTWIRNWFRILNPDRDPPDWIRIHRHTGINTAVAYSVLTVLGLN